MLTGLPVLRCARPDDAKHVAAVHEAAWRAAYAPMIARGELSIVPFARRVAQWSVEINRGGPGRATQLFLAESDGRVAGLALLGLQRDPALCHAGWRAELHALYVHPHMQRRGLGRMLVSAVAHRVLDLGGTRLALWALRKHRPARAFYTALGGCRIAMRPGPQGREMLARTAYGWSDLVTLV